MSNRIITGCIGDIQLKNIGRFRSQIVTVKTNTGDEHFEIDDSSESFDFKYAVGDQIKAEVFTIVKNISGNPNIKVCGKGIEKIEDDFKYKYQEDLTEDKDKYVFLNTIEMTGPVGELKLYDEEIGIYIDDVGNYFDEDNNQCDDGGMPY